MRNPISAYLPLLWISLSFLAGILLASQIMLPVTIWLILAGAALVIAILWWVLAPRYGWRILNLQPAVVTIIALCLIAVCLGGARYQAAMPRLTPDFITAYRDTGEEVLVTGRLVEPPDIRDTHANLRLQVEAIDTGSGEDTPVQGLILASIQPDQALHYGNRIRLRGELLTPPEGEEFSYRDYLARQGIHAYMPYAQATRLPGQAGNPVLSALYALRERSQTTLYQILPDPEASLLAGILLGIDTGIPADLQQAFKDTGTAHIIAISGFNVAILSSLLVSVFSRLLGPRRGALAAIVGLALYTLLAGAEASIVRAAIMGGFSLFARQIGRRQHGLNTLCFSAALMVLFNPNLPWDVGFQLSFFATLGLVLYAQPLQQAAVDFLAKRLPATTALKVASPLAEYLLFTLAAQVTTLPLIAYHFQRIPLIALVANPFILPAQPPVMVLGGAALLLSLIYLPLGRLAAYLAWPFTAYTIRMVELLDRVPGSVLVLGDFSLLFVLLFFAVLLGWTLAGNRLKSLRIALPPAAILALLAILVTLVWRATLAIPDKRLHLTFLDAGSADSILIRTPTGRAVLINGGTSATRLSDGLGRRLSPFNRGLDYLIIASPQEDQVAALPRTLERFPPGAVLWAGNREASYSSRLLNEYLVEAGMPVTRAESGFVLDLGSGATLRVVNANPRGAVLLVEWQGFRALLPIGMNFDALETMEYGESIGPVTLLLLAESGYAPVNPAAWIENLQPRLIVLDVAADDPDGLPNQETLAAVENYNLLRTDQNGWIHVTTDGVQIWIEVEKP